MNGAGAPAVVLLVDDEEFVRAATRAVLEHDGFEVLEAGSAAEAREIMDSEPGAAIEAVLLDIRMPNESGLQLLPWIRQRQGPRVIMLTVSTAVADAITALKGGAHDYLIKPIAHDELCHTVRGAVEHARMARELAAWRALDALPLAGEGVFASPVMRRLLAVADAVKDSEVPVLIQGESGTGKEVIARLLHARGKRKDAPFVAINCAALPKDLVEAELFGHEKGAFTGALARRPGRFEEAGDGTLFLDEVGELDQPVQAKLLRALQEREVQPLGGARIKVRARVVVATNRNLAADVAAGRFREDLFYRLDVISLHLPPLRERLGEIPLLAVHILAKFAKQEGRPAPELTPEAIAALRAHPWPGNVRELENVLKRSMLLSQAPVLGPGDLAFQSAVGHWVPGVPPAKAPVAAGEQEVSGGTDEQVRKIRDYEPELMLRALAETQGNVTEAARRLGIGRATFYRWSAKHGLARR